MQPVFLFRRDFIKKIPIFLKKIKKILRNKTIPLYSGTKFKKRNSFRLKKVALF